MHINYFFVRSRSVQPAGQTHRPHRARRRPAHRRRRRPEPRRQPLDALRGQAEVRVQKEPDAGAPVERGPAKGGAEGRLGHPQRGQRGKDEGRAERRRRGGGAAGSGGGEAQGGAVESRAGRD